MTETELEITKAEAMSLLLVDDELSDLTLKSKLDGTEVLAHRAILAVRSPVFRRMLYGNFNEASQSTVELQYSGDTIKALVEYIYNDHVLLSSETQLQEDSKNDDDKDNDCAPKKSAEEEEWKKDFALATAVVSTIEAASFFSLPQFRKKCEDVAMKMMTKCPDFCVFFLVLCERHASLRWSDTEKYTEKDICLRPNLLFKNTQLLSSLSYKRIESFVHSKSIQATEFDLFTLVQNWANENDCDHNTLMAEKALSAPFEFDTRLTESRPKAARKLLRHVDLTRIDPVKLMTTVKSSGLVSEEQLQDVTTAVLMRTYQQKYFIPYNLPRMLVWEDSSSTTFESYAEPS